MKQIVINTGQKISKIIVGATVCDIHKYVPGKKIIIVTDSNVRWLYGDSFNMYPVVEIGLGEKNKTLDTVSLIIKKFMEYEVDRSWYVVAVGGGIVCDVTGFAASVYMRGLPFGFVATTLLAQVDASVGGKNGVNYEGYKNMVGVFNQPDFVICDIESLNSLDEKEYIAGFAEIIKAGIIKDIKLFEFLEENSSKALKKDYSVLERIICDSVSIKAKVVEVDEKEQNERRKLNFGHTFAHSLEKNSRMLHGEAVAMGMVFASDISAKLGYIKKEEALRIKNLIMQYKLPVSTSVKVKEIFSAIKKDKKREENKIHLVLLGGIGNAIVEPVLLVKLEEIINDLYLHI